jgi:hypothetical protein
MNEELLELIKKVAEENNLITQVAIKFRKSISNNIDNRYVFNFNTDEVSHFNSYVKTN